MLFKIEAFIHSLFLNLLEGKMKFYAVNAGLNLLEKPQYADKYIAIASFSKKDYSYIKDQVEELRPHLVKYSQQNIGYQNVIMTLITETLSDYSYIFADKFKHSVQSSLIFMLLNTLSENTLEDIVDYICVKELTEVFAKPQLFNHSYIFSTCLHNVIQKGYDMLALKIALHLDNKSLLFVKDVDGLTPLEMAREYSCNLSADYIGKIKEIGESVGIISSFSPVFV
jgi:hypothetical protein